MTDTNAIDDILKNTPVTLSNFLTLGHIMPAVIYVAENYELEQLKDLPLYLHSLLFEGGILTWEGELTKNGKDILSCVDMLKYIIRVTVDMSNSEKVATRPDYYDCLRKGLGQVAKTRGIPLYGSIMVDILHRRPQVNPLILDMGGGDGTFLEAMVRMTKGSGILADRSLDSASEILKHEDIRGIQCELKDSEWTRIYDSTFDIIMLNEVMHLGDASWWEYLLDLCSYMLKPGGLLFVGELVPTPGFDWRMHALTESGGSIPIEYITAAYQAHENFTPFMGAHNDYYYIASAIKEGTNETARPV